MITLNTVKEVLDYIRENIKKYEPTAYITYLQETEFGVLVVASSERGGVSKTITYPMKLVKFPIEVEEGDWEVRSSSISSKNWLLNMIICEIIKK